MSGGKIWIQIIPRMLAEVHVSNLQLYSPNPKLGRVNYTSHTVVYFLKQFVSLLTDLLHLFYFMSSLKWNETYIDQDTLTWTDVHKHYSELVWVCEGWWGVKQLYKHYCYPQNSPRSVLLLHYFLLISHLFRWRFYEKWNIERTIWRRETGRFEKTKGKWSVFCLKRWHRDAEREEWGSTGGWPATIYKAIMYCDFSYLALWRRVLTQHQQTSEQLYVSPHFLSFWNTKKNQKSRNSPKCVQTGLLL